MTVAFSPLSEPMYDASHMEDEFAFEREELAELADLASLGCCQHSSFAYVLLDGMRFCVCRECSHSWMVVLGGPDERGYCEADGIQNDVPGVEARA